MSNSALVTRDSARDSALIPVVEALLGAGAPPEALREVDVSAGEALDLAAHPGIDLVATDADPALARAFDRVLGPTPEGARGLKALISNLDGPRPGDPGFARRFAWPRVIAVRTLRHGADLALDAPREDGAHGHRVE